MDKKELGYFGEKVTAYYLEKKGYKILRRNFCVKGGEIDIIAEKDGVSCDCFKKAAYYKSIGRIFISLSARLTAKI